MPTDLFAAGIPQTSARAVGCVAFAPTPDPTGLWLLKTESISVVAARATHGTVTRCPVLFSPVPLVSLKESHCDDTRQGRLTHSMSR